MTDTKRFKATLVLKGYTLEDLAHEMSMSTATLSYKINNIRQFKVAEIQAIKKILNLSVEERDAIFFADNVEE